MKKSAEVYKSLAPRINVFFILLIIFTLLATGSMLQFTQQSVSAGVVRQNSTTCSNASAATIACTVTAPTNGNTLIATIGTRGTTAGRVSSITQTGATWVRANQATNATGVTTEIWYANNVSGAGTSVTINLAATLKASAVIAEYSGILTSPLDQNTGTSTGSSTASSTGTSGTTTTADQLWIGAIASANGGYTHSAPTNSFSIIGEVNSTGNPASGQNDTVYLERTVSATGTASTGTTISTSTPWAGAVATFKAEPTPTKIVFTTAARTLTAGTCSGAGSIITIELQDSTSTPATPTGSTVVRVSSNSPSETIYSDASCATPITNGDITFSTTETTKSFYIIDTRKSGPTWTLTAAKQSGPQTLTDGTQSITTNAAATARLQTTLPGQTFTDGTGNSGGATNRTAGTSFTITSISATDIYNNVTTGYSGAKTLVYSGPGNAPLGTAPTYTTAVSFTNGVSTTTLTTTLYNAQTVAITVTDGGSYGYASSSVTIDPGVINNYAVSATTPNIAGTCVAGSSITARDQWNNTRTTDTTVVNMTTTGTALTFYTAAGCGTSTTQYTMSGGTSSVFFRTNKKQTGITITATKVSDTPTGTSGAITINPAAASALVIRLPGQSFTDGTGISGGTNFTGLRTPNATAGTSFTVDIKAVDAFNNLVDTGPNNYTGAKTISWATSTAGNAPSGQTPSFPGSVTFTNGAADTQTITYYNAATLRTVDADDTGTPVSGTASSTFTVQSAAIQNYSVVPAAAGQTAGVAFNVTVTARDQWNNLLGALYSAPAGTYAWTSNATNAPDTTAPNLGSLIQANFVSGVATKSVTLYKAEAGVTFTATEPGPGSTGTSTTTVTVSPGNVSADTIDSTVTGAATGTITTPHTITVTLRDTWRNPKSGVAAAYVVLTATGGGTVTQPASATDANGQTTGTITWPGTGVKTVSAQINTISLVQNDGTTADADGFLDNTLAVTINLPAADARLKGGTTIRGGTRF